MSQLQVNNPFFPVAPAPAKKIEAIIRTALFLREEFEPEVAMPS